MTGYTVPPILPKPQRLPIIFIPVTFAPAQFAQSTLTSQTLSTIVPSAPPLPPFQLLQTKRRRVPILIDQRSLKKNLQSNKQSLQNKLEKRPEPNALIERGILQTEGSDSRRSQQRELLRRRIEKRPSKKDLVTQGILLSDAGVDPLVQVRGQLLKRNKLADNLNSKLRKRPGPLELVTRKILQVDADLEQAIQEGRLPFTPVESPGSLPAGMISTQLAPSRFEDVKPPHVAHNHTPPLLSSGPKAKIRKKSQQIRASTPYDSACANASKIVKIKTATGNRKFTDGAIDVNVPMETDNEPAMGQMRLENNYEITLKQQQIFLQWQDEHHKNSAVDVNALTPAMSSSTSNCSTPLQSLDGTSIHSARSSFSVSSAHSGNQGQAHLSSGCSRSASPAFNECFPATLVEVDKPKSKLAEFKVQDLKNECKKRQLPVSGAKPQLLERLRPYEDAILASSAENKDQQTEATATYVSYQQQQQQQQNCSHRHMATCQSVTCQPAQDVIHEYLQQQCQPNMPQKSLVLQIPQNGNIVQVLNKSPSVQTENPLLFKLVDSNGSVVGVATVPQNIQQQQQQHPQKTNMSCSCAQCNGTQLITTSGEPFVFSEAKVCEPTFSFAQMGSGGQFTLAKSSTGVVSECRQIMPNCAGCIAAASQNTTSNGNVFESPSTMKKSKGQSKTGHANMCSSAQKSSQQHVVVSMPQKSQTTQHVRPSVEQSVAAVAHRRHSTPSVHVLQHEPQNEDLLMSPADTVDDKVPELDLDDADDVSLDEIDPNTLLTAKTFALHEENLRQQQKMIDDLQKELAKSQEHLKREQKLIIAAKKLQLKVDKTTGKQCTQAEILLNNLDVKNVNKLHIQHFLQHKNQQQSTQNLNNNYQQLSQTEQKLQEELHVEQAVQDIVRLIKQDGRTALLIVQLLRRYQLERNNQLQVREQSQNTDSSNEQYSEVSSSSEQHKTGANVVVIDDTPVCSPVEKCAESNQKKETAKGKPKTTKRKNNGGSRSIWSRPEVFEKKTAEKTTVDMEEIFRSVIDGCRDSEPSTAKAVVVSQEEQHVNDVSSDLVPQLHGFHLVTNDDFSQGSDDKIQFTSNPAEICTTAIFIHADNNSSCQVDCYSKPANSNSPERIQFSKQHQEFAATQHHPHHHHHHQEQQQHEHQYDYSQNEDFEDLMDVLRDDEQGVSTYDNANSASLGYTTVELANFLASGCENGVPGGANDMYEFHHHNGPPTHFIQLHNYQYSQNQHQNFDMETPSMDNDPLPIEPHQEQAIEDMLNGDMLDSSVEWFDNFLQSSGPERQTSTFNNATNSTVQRPMDTFV